MMKDSNFTHLQLIGYLSILHSLQLANAQNPLCHFRHVVVDVAMKHVQLLLLRIVIFPCPQIYDCSLFSLLVHQQIEAAVTDTRQQIALERIRMQVGMAIQQLGEHVTHHVLAFLIISQHLASQSEHSAVILFENSFELPFVCHLLLVTFYL